MSQVITCSRVTMHLSAEVAERVKMTFNTFENVEEVTLLDNGGFLIDVPALDEDGNEQDGAMITYYYPASTFTRLKFEL